MKTQLIWSRVNWYSDGWWLLYNNLYSSCIFHIKGQNSRTVLMYYTLYIDQYYRTVLMYYTLYIYRNTTHNTTQSSYQYYSTWKITIVHLFEHMSVLLYVEVKCESELQSWLLTGWLVKHAVEPHSKLKQVADLIITQGHFYNRTITQGHFHNTTTSQGHLNNASFTQGHFHTVTITQGHIHNKTFTQGHFHKMTNSMSFS